MAGNDKIHKMDICNPKQKSERIGLRWAWVNKSHYVIQDFLLLGAINHIV